MVNNQTNYTEQFMAEMTQIILKYQRNQMSEQIAWSMRRKAEAGYWLHRPPVGYSPSMEKGVYRVNRQGRTMRELMKRLAKGDISKEYFHFSLCYVLSPSPKSVATINGIRRLVSNPFYAGKVSHKSELYDGLHEPLISQEEQEQILENLKK